MAASAPEPNQQQVARRPSQRRLSAFAWRLLPLVLGFIPALLFGLVAGWFVHKLVDLGKLPWQTLVQTLVIVVVLMVIAALRARAAFKMAAPRLVKALSRNVSELAEQVRKTPAAAGSVSFWLDHVWPALREGKALVFAWVGVYSTMAAVIALAALLGQTGSLAVAYLQIDRLDKQNETHPHPAAG